MRFVEGEDIVYELTSKKMVKVGVWKEKNVLLVNIRDYKYYGGAHLHDVKGIALTLPTWRKLYSNIHDINDDVENLAFQ